MSLFSLLMMETEKYQIIHFYCPLARQATECGQRPSLGMADQDSRGEGVVHVTGGSGRNGWERQMRQVQESCLKRICSKLSLYVM